MDYSLNPHLRYSLAEMRRRLYEWGEQPHRLSDSEVLQRFIVLKDRYAEPVLHEDSGAREEKPVEAPVPVEEVVPEKNWIFVQHLRKEPGPKRLPHEREVDEEFKPVPSTADIYIDGGLFASVKLPTDGKPLKVEIPVGVSECEVVYRDDWGGKYAIVDQPYSNPFTDETQEPSPGQAYLLKHLRTMRA